MKKDIQNSKNWWNNLKRRRKKKIKFNNRFKIIICLFLLLTIYFVFIQYKRSFNKEIDISSEKNYFSKNYNSNLNLYNKRLVYDKYSNLEGKFTKIQNTEWKIVDPEINSYKTILEDRIYQYLNDKQISPDILSLYIEKDGKVLLDINSNKEENIGFTDQFKNIISIDNHIRAGVINTKDSITLQESDFSSGSFHYSKSMIGGEVSLKNLVDVIGQSNDWVAQNAINRYLIQKNQNILSGINENIANGRSINSLVKILSASTEEDSMLYRIFEKVSSEEIFQKAIYSSRAKIYMNQIGNNYIIEVGKLNLTYPYYYSIYIEKNDEKIVQDIGDIVDRTINEYESKKIIN